MIDAAARATHRKRIAEQGYTIVPEAIEPELVEALLARLDQLEGELDIRPAKNRFEGRSTHRIYNLLAHGEVFEKVPVHPNILPLVESVLDEGCLVSSLSSISILAGEKPQPIHADDQLIPLPKPHPPIVCNTMWALTDFTEENGATRVIPGSHLRDGSPMFGEAYETLPAEMKKGSVLVYDGALWHGGGENRTTERRVGVAMNYCAGFMRQQENQQLGLDRARVRGFSTRLRELVGYGVYNGLIGHIDRRPPMQLLDETPT